MNLHDPLVAYQFDAAVVALGRIIDNALAERVTVGTGKDAESRPRYTIDQILDPVFRLPAPPPTKVQAPSLGNGGLAAILAMAGQPGSGVKKWEYVGPPN